MIKIAINGFGRIGRPTFKKLIENKNVKVMAINDLTDTKTLAHLLKYDSVYGIYNRQVGHTKKGIKVDGKEYSVLAEKDPGKLPWKRLGVDVVLECTGFFTDYQGAKKHLSVGAKKVIVSANSKTEKVPHFVLGVNEEKYNSENNNVVAMGSCTTNCLVPIAKILNEEFKIKKGFITTVHSYTNTQRILDLPHKNLREARAAALSIIPTSTGAVQAVSRVIPELKGKIDGIALRVPTPTVSILDLICEVEKKTSVKEVNDIFKKVAQGKLKGILDVTKEPLVSVDLRGNSHSAIVDLSLTMVNDRLLKVVAWYDNEWGYACRLAEMAEYIGKKI